MKGFLAGAATGYGVGSAVSAVMVFRDRQEWSPKVPEEAAMAASLVLLWPVFWGYVLHQISTGDLK